MPHVGRIPSTLEKYRHALSAYLDDVTQLNSQKGSNNSYSFLYFDEKTDEPYKPPKNGNNTKCATPIPDTETRINSSYDTVKKQLDLLSSYFSLIHEDLHGDLLLLRTNLNLLPSNTLHIAQQNNTNSSSQRSLHASLHTNSDHDELSDSNYSHSMHSASPPTSTTGPALASDVDIEDVVNEQEEDCDDDDEEEEEESLGMDNILNTKQTQSIQYIVSILQKFIKYNSILVEYIHSNKCKIDSFWIHNHVINDPQIHKLNLDVESIVSTMCIKDLIATKSSSCHNILFHDILGCANTKQFFTRIYFIVSIWYGFFHSLHLTEYHPEELHDDEDNNVHYNQEDDDEPKSSKPCNNYLTKLFVMTDFSFLTKSSNPTQNNNNNNASSTSSSTTTTATMSATMSNTVSNSSRSSIASSTVSSRRLSNSYSNGNDQDNETENETKFEVQNWSDCDCEGSDEELSAATHSASNSKNDFLLKYLNAQNNYLQSIWYDGIALLEYSLHLLQQQEFRLSCRVGHRCLELFQKQQIEQERQRRDDNQWNALNEDLYDHNHGNNNNTHHNVIFNGAVNPSAQIPGLWYIEMHLANCYHTWGQSNMALFHINRTLEQLGNYQINPDSLTVRLNTRRKFKLLSSYLVASVSEKNILPKAKQPNLRRNQSSPILTALGENEERNKTKKGFMGRLKINNRRRRKSNGMFSKLFDRFSSAKKKKRVKQQQQQKALSMDNEDDDEKEKEFEEEEEEEDIDDVDLQNNETDDDEESDNDDDDEESDEEDFEISYFHNDSDSDQESDNEENTVNNNNSNNNNNNNQMITLEALLSMHMTKGRILIEMKLLREALNLYTYIINECESLIKYHSMINGHHVELEREYDIIEEEKEEMAFFNDSPRRHHRRRRNRERRRSNFSEIDLNDDTVNDHSNNNNNNNNESIFNSNGPPPNTPYRRLTKNIGLENYYAARGDIFFKFKDLKNALKDFSNAIKYGKCKKEMGIYYNLRGVCYHEMKQYDRALKDYDNAVKSMYGNHVAWNNRAALLVDMRLYDDAIENANNAIKLDPSYGNAYKHRGVAYHLKCEFEKAITDINRCIKLLPNYRPARLALLAIWKDIFECVRVVNVDEGVPLDLVKIMVDYTVGNGYEIDEYMVNFTYC